MRKGWRGEKAGGHSVLFSQDLGPAVVGYVRPEIVLPGWCRELEDHTLGLILDHELEHLRAGDLRLILSAGVFPILLPWHLPIWWQFQRLRLAAEGDCDLRVLRKYPERTRPYMELLLEVGSRVRRAQPLAAMLSESEETLERRIRIMTMPFPKKPWIRGVLLAVVGGILVAVACWAPSPTDIQEQQAELQAIVIPQAPTFTPFTVKPDIRNRADVARALEREYPPLLRDAGIGGTVNVWFYIDETGKVARVQVDKSSGHKALDDAALRVSTVIEFTPALNKDKPVPVWISLPISFMNRGAEPEQPREEASNRVEVVDLPPPPEGVVSKDISARPTFTPFTVRPDIRNRTEVARALERAYPPLLRDAGIGGTIDVWFFIDDEGVVQRTALDKSSGHEALDNAALEVARVISFTPAMNGDKRVPVWISLPITFTTR
ncbi:MAG: TonB family protein [Longimicrobiales bacterium]|nr:TonB family protein [Longimicrobiales bacterium]